MNADEYQSQMEEMEQTMKHFEQLAAINVGEHIEKKGQLSYLSWAWAVDQLLRNDPAATWSYGEPMRWNDTVMVFCTVSAFGKQMTSQLPVMDHKNKAIANPDAMQVNTAMQRCLAKAIALHGIGLYIYAGEDLPMEDQEAKAEAENKAREVAMGIIAQIQSAATVEEIEAFYKAAPESIRKQLIPACKKRKEQLAEVA